MFWMKHTLVVHTMWQRKELCDIQWLLKARIDKQTFSLSLQRKSWDTLFLAPKSYDPSHHIIFLFIFKV